MRDGKWVRYRHKKNPKIEYDVEHYPAGAYHPSIDRPLPYYFTGEECFKVRTIRNLLRDEEIHQPAYTSMPAERFLAVYEKVG